MDSGEVPGSAQHLRPLLGRWVGQGQGLWKAEPVVRYREEVIFGATGRPLLSYLQRTQALADGRAMHTETGYLRAVAADGVELLIIQPTGFAEIYTGTMSEDGLALQLSSLTRTPTALPVTAIERRWSLSGETLTYLVRIAMNGEPLADHLSGELHREPTD